MRLSRPKMCGIMNNSISVLPLWPLTFAMDVGFFDGRLLLVKESKSAIPFRLSRTIGLSNPVDE